MGNLKKSYPFFYAFYKNCIFISIYTYTKIYTHIFGKTNKLLYICIQLKYYD